jgi:spermidine/putrescine-binding protein
VLSSRITSGYRLLGLAATLTVAVSLTAACGSAPTEQAGTASASKAATATSAQDLGGMDALIAEAKKEGQLNVIALPHDWANYGEVISAFKAKYGLKMNEENPDGSSSDEIHRLRRQGRRDLPEDLRRPAQARVQGQGRAERQPDQVRLGVRRRVRRLARQRRVLRRHPARPRFLQEAQGVRQLQPRRDDHGDRREGRDADQHRLDWQVVVPADGQYAAYYAQAINKDAPHPAAARLWMEFLYSPEGQNLYLKGYARPAMLTSMEADKTADPALVAKLPKVEGTPTFPTEAQVKKAQEAIATGWSAAVAG